MGAKTLCNACGLLGERDRESSCERKREGGGERADYFIQRRERLNKKMCI